MPRVARQAPGGYIYHVLNRGVGRMQLFSKPADYEAFERVLAETLAKIPMAICGYGLMPNHWHFVVRPTAAGELGRFFQRLTVTHATRWQRNRRRVGYGHVYQGRFKSFPVEEDQHFYQVMRYIERNPYRANLVADACDWRWSSLWIREAGTAEQRAMLATWPLPCPRNWSELVREPQTESELAALRESLVRGAPFGSPHWTHDTAGRLGLESTLRSRGKIMDLSQDLSPFCLAFLPRTASLEGPCN
jgi:putative transposase